MLPPGFAVSVTVPPLHIGPLLVGLAVGVWFTVAVVVNTTTQPGCVVPFDTVMEYVAVVVGVAVGFSAVGDDRLRPLHVYADVDPPILAVRFNVPPLQIGPEFVGAAVGAAFTVTVMG